MDAVDVRQRSSSRADDRRPATELVADLRELHRSARPADADRHRRQSLRRRGRGVRAQRLGPVAPRRRQGRRAWIAPSRPAPDSSASTQPGVAEAVRDARARVPTICCCSCTTCRTRTCCTSGKTVIQYIYDSHYDGADAVAGYVRKWKALKGKIDDERYQAVLEQLDVSGRPGDRLARCRDEVVLQAPRASPIHAGRVGNLSRADRSGVGALWTATRSTAVTPWEAASGGQAVECARRDVHGDIQVQRRGRLARSRRAVFRHQHRRVAFPRARRSTGRRRVDRRRSRANEEGGRLVVERAESSPAWRCRPGDQIAIEGVPDGAETAALDYIEINER